MGALSSVHPLESGGRTRRFGLVVGGHGRNFGQQLRWAGQSAIYHTAFPQGQKKVGAAKNLFWCGNVYLVLSQFPSSDPACAGSRP